MTRKRCPVCRRRDVAEINYRLASGGRGSTRTVAQEYGIDYLIMKQHRGHKMPKSKKAPLSDEALRRIDEGDAFIQAHLQQLDESGEMLRRYLERKEQRAGGESRPS
jgi:hypothetical protein